MATLKEQASHPEKRSAIIADALVVLDQEVADKSGLGGIAVKTAYKVVKGVSPGFLQQVVNHLLDDFLDAIEPVYEEVDGWNAPTTEVRNWEDLPKAAMNYVKQIEDFLGIPVAIVSVGPKRSATLTRIPIWDKA